MRMRPRLAACPLDRQSLPRQISSLKSCIISKLTFTRGGSACVSSKNLITIGALSLSFLLAANQVGAYRRHRSGSLSNYYCKFVCFVCATTVRQASCLRARISDYGTCWFTIGDGSWLRLSIYIVRFATDRIAYVLVSVCVSC